jgi:hypothetical protein
MQKPDERGEHAMSLSGPLPNGTATCQNRGPHHRRWAFCIEAGEIDVGGLVKVMPVLGLTIGITLRVRTADGCWKFT